jgi:tripeptidyl-peptidase-1
VIESELHCKFERFGNPLTNSTILRSRIGYSVPVELAPHLDFIGGIQRFPTLRHSQRITDEPGLGVTPRIVRDRYHVTTYGNNGRNRQAVAQFLDQYYDPLDFQEFFLLFFWEGIGALPTVIGPNYPYLAGVEASLDIEYIMSVGANISTIFYSTPGLHENQEPFLDWAILVSNTSDSAIPYVISVSYGDDEDSLDKAYTDRINNEFQKLGTRGVSIFFASGDDGVGCNTQGTAFVPDYPASSPYVTAVGGTWTDYFFELGPEIVNGLSGGGFSNFYAAPSYQTDAVSYYLAHANNLPAPSFYNRTGRAYPDVSALSFGFVVVINLVPFPGVAGTSCSAPSFAGVISMVNDQRLNAGKKPLGFLNPLIYQHPEVFYDVTEGCNPGGCPNDGFCAAPSWDPASGFGSPLYDKFVQLALSLQ